MQGNATGESRIHEDFSRRAAIKLSADRTFGLVFGTFFTGVGVFPLLHGLGVRRWALGLGLAFFLAALVRPSIIHPLNLASAKVSGVLHRIMSPLMAGLFFFAILTPFAVLRRAFVKDPLGLRFRPEEESYWVKRENPGPAPETMVNQF